jgi:hypothetical protein
MASHNIHGYLGPEAMPNGAFAHIYALRCGHKIKMQQGGIEPGTRIEAGPGEGQCLVCREATRRLAAATANADQQHLSGGGIGRGQFGGFDAPAQASSVDADLGGLEDDGEVIGVEDDPYPEV